MPHRLSIRLPAAGQHLRSRLLPRLVFGLALWIGFPTTVALQDMASMVSGEDTGTPRWAGFVEKSVAGSVHAAEMPFSDSAGTIAGAGLDAPGIGKVAFRGKATARNPIPDEDRVQRADKKGRLVEVAPVAPPKLFNAGSVFDRTSALFAPGADRLAMTFVKPGIRGKEIEIAAAFHPRRDGRAEPGVPAVLASLVTSDTPDILATAYAPAEPDYAKISPFESLLGSDDPARGRFIPPVVEGDHAWMKKPLPAAVFTSAEQKCLANAIYFEARGESPKGQAAVAQVVLNRVRNPAYPSTICGVVYQNDRWRNRCQFSFACDGIKDRVLSPAHYRLAEEIAMAVTAGRIFVPEIGSSTHYYATYVRPGWARTMEKMKKIGLHIFYRTYGGGWS